MQKQKPIHRAIPARLSAFNLSGKWDFATHGAHRLSTLRPYETSFYGYEKLDKKKPVYSLDNIESLKATYSILKANKFNVGKCRSLFEVETAAVENIEKFRDNGCELTFISWDELKDTKLESYFPENLREGHHLIAQKDLSSDFYGCHFYKDMLKGANQDIIEVALTLQTEFLGVYYWRELDLDYVDDYLEQIAMEEYDPEDEKEEPMCNDWKQSNRTVYTNSGHSLVLSDIGKCMDEWATEAPTFYNMTKRVFNTLTIEKLEEMMARDCDEAILLKAIVYLVCKQFHLSHYEPITADYYDSTQVPLTRQYCIYYAYDSFFIYIDSWTDEATPDEPCTITVLSENYRIESNKNIVNERLFSIFADTFSYDPSKNKLDESKKHQICANIADFDLLKWKELLRRRIKSAAKRRMGIHPAAKPDSD